MALTYPLIILINYAPESPWFLSQKGCVEEATSVIIRIQKKGSKVDNLQDTIAMMIRTDGHEKMVSAGTTYWDQQADLVFVPVACTNYSSTCNGELLD
jgi:hypothetical protein